jgi:hypothetical protein
VEDRSTEIDALQIAIREILKNPANAAVKIALKKEADNKINHGLSVGDSGNYEQGLGAQLLKLTGD